MGMSANARRGAAVDASSSCISTCFVLIFHWLRSVQIGALQVWAHSAINGVVSLTLIPVVHMFIVQPLHSLPVCPLFFVSITVQIYIITP